MVRNPSRRDLVVNGVEARVVSVAPKDGRASCSASWYQVEPFGGSLELLAGATVHLVLAVRFVDLPDVNQDACKGARYTFAFDVRARQV
jgi:hypothetical protein